MDGYAETTDNYGRTTYLANDSQTKYVVEASDYPEESPNEWGYDKTYIYRTAYKGMPDTPECPISDAFYRVYEHNHDEDLALKVARRYAIILQDWEPAQTLNGIQLHTLRGYSQGDWWDTLTISPDWDANLYAETFQQWLRGDIYLVTEYSRIECNNDDCHGSDNDHWELSGGLGGIYADDPETALKDYLN